MHLLSRRQGQSTAEYAVVIAIVLGAAVGLQTYVKRGLQAKFKAASEKLVGIDGATSGGNLTLGKTLQYEPYYAERHVATTGQLADGGSSDVSEHFTGTASGLTVTRGEAGHTTIRSVKRELDASSGGEHAQIENAGKAAIDKGGDWK